MATITEVFEAAETVNRLNTRKVELTVQRDGINARRTEILRQLNTTETQLAAAVDDLKTKAAELSGV